MGKNCPSPQLGVVGSRVLEERTAGRRSHFLCPPALLGCTISRLYLISCCVLSPGLHHPSHPKLTKWGIIPPHFGGRKLTLPEVEYLAQNKIETQRVTLQVLSIVVSGSVALQGAGGDHGVWDAA